MHCASAACSAIVILGFWKGSLLTDLREIEVTYTLTPEDVVAFSTIALKGLPEYRTGRRRSIRMQRQALLTVGLLVCAALYGAWQLMSSGSSGASVPLVTLAVVLFLSFARLANPKWYDQASTELARSAASRGELDWIRGEYRLSVDSSGVASSGPHGEGRTKWSGVERVLRDESFTGIVLRSGIAHIVPARAFSDRAEAERFFELCDDLLRAHGAHPASLATEYLDERDALCASCSYNLRGMKVDRCPECGELIDINELKERERRESS